VFIDNSQVLYRELIDFEVLDVNFNISYLSLIQIYWYSPTENNAISLLGNLSYQITTWNTSDSTPFFRTVEWYTEDPITTDASWNFGLDNFVGLKWWFNLVEDVDGDGVPDEEVTNVTDFGGFGIWGIDFQEVGEMDVIDGDTIAIPGYHPSVTYLRIPSISGGDYDAEGRVLEVEYIDSWNPDSNISYLIVTAHGLELNADDGRIVETGVLRNVAEVPFSTLNSAITDVFETVERGLIRGQRYYYLVDTYDTSPGRNRGGMTETYQTIIAGDYVNPDPVQGLVGTRVDSSTVELTWEDHEGPYNVASWNVYSDAISADYPIIYMETDFIALSDYTAVEMAFNASGGQLLVSIENSVGAKNIRRFSSSSGGGVFMLSEPLPYIDYSGTLRMVAIVSTFSNRILPRPPIIRPPDIYETE